MGKNLIHEVCQLLNVEIDEEFKFSNSANAIIYKFDNEGLKFYNKDSKKWCYSDNAFCELMTGKLGIIKLPWKPKIDEIYWTFDYFLDIISNEPFATWKVCDKRWCQTPIDLALFEKGWVYRTSEEAETALPDIAKKLGVAYEL